MELADVKTSVPVNKPIFVYQAMLSVVGTILTTISLYVIGATYLVWVIASVTITLSPGVNVVLVGIWKKSIVKTEPSNLTFVTYILLFGIATYGSAVVTMLLEIELTWNISNDLTSTVANCPVTQVNPTIGMIWKAAMNVDIYASEGKAK
jgi:hypothetical protein